VSLSDGRQIVPFIDPRTISIHLVTRDHDGVAPLNERKPLTQAEQERAARILDRLVASGVSIVGKGMMHLGNRVKATVVQLPNGERHSVQFGRNYLPQMTELGKKMGVATD
jgi:hypothetical protein